MKKCQVPLGGFFDSHCNSRLISHEMQTAGSFNSTAVCSFHQTDGPSFAKCSSLHLCAVFTSSTNQHSFIVFKFPLSPMFLPFPTQIRPILTLA